MSAVHDISDGGLLVAIAEMALAGNIGAQILVGGSRFAGDLFGEDQGRYVVTGQWEPIHKLAMRAGVGLLRVGTTVRNGIWITDP